MASSSRFWWEECHQLIRQLAHEDSVVLPGQSLGSMLEILHDGRFGAREAVLSKHLDRFHEIQLDDWF